MTIDRNNVWISIPAFNEDQVLADVINRTLNAGYKNIVVIDDGSSDDTAVCAKNAGAHVVSLCINRGVGAAFKTAFYLAQRKGWEFMVFIDADGQHYPEDIDGLVEKMRETDSDVVIGSRFLENYKSVPHIRRVFNYIANVFTASRSINLTDSQSGFRLFNKKAIQSIELYMDDYSACSEMILIIKKKKLKVSEASIRVVYTEYSMSKGQSFLRGVETGFNLLKRIIQ